MNLVGDLWLLVAVYAVALPLALGRLPLLCAATFFAVGGAGTLQLQDHGWTIPAAVSLLAAGSSLVGAAIGAVPRLTAARLALATWALGWLSLTVWLDVPALAGGQNGIAGPPRHMLRLPALGVAWRLTNLELALSAIAIAGLAALGNRRLARSPIGLRLRADRQSPEFVAVVGGRIARDRALAIGLSAAVLAVAGAGSAVSVNVISPVDAGPLLSLQLVLAALVTGDWRWWGPICGTAVLVGLNHIAAALPSGIDVSSAQAIVTAVAFTVVLLARRFTRPDPVARIESTDDLPAPTKTGDQHVWRLTSVGVEFGSLPALTDVSFEVASGEVVGLVGPNGSGKTTGLKVLTGEIMPTTGGLSIDGIPMKFRGNIDGINHGVARTLQSRGLIGSMTVRDHVELGAAAGSGLRIEWLRRLSASAQSRSDDARRREVADHALAATGLFPLADQQIRHLDGGILPLVAIASTIATGARLLCLDEPAAGMDAMSRSRLEPLVRRLAASGYGVVLVDHDLDLIERIADRVVELEAGRIKHGGGPGHVDPHSLLDSIA